MSLIGGLVDAHHETELSPSVRVVKNNWIARHMGALALLCLAAGAIALIL